MTLVAHPLGAVGQGGERAQGERVAIDRAQRRDRRVAGGVQSGGQRPLRHHAHGGVEVGDLRRGRVGVAVVGAPLERERALAGGGQHRVGVEDGAGLARAPEPAQPGEREHDRVALAVGELAQAGVDVAAQVDDLEVGARPRAAAARRRSDAVPTRRPRRASDASRRAAARARPAGPRAAARASSSSPSASSAGTSLAEWTARSISSVEQRPLELVDPARLVPDRASRGRRAVRDLDDRDVARRSASATALGLRQRQRAARVCPSLTGERRRSSRTSRRCVVGGLVAARSSSANSSRSTCSRACAPVARRRASAAASARAAAGDATARATASTPLAVARRTASPTAGVLAQHLLDDLRRRAARSAAIVGTTSSVPSQRAKRSISSSMIASARRASALAHLRLRATTRLQVVHVVERDAGQAAAGRVDVARHGDVDHQQRPARRVRRITSSSSSGPTIACGDAVDATTMSAASSSSGRSSKRHGARRRSARPAPRARSWRRLATKTVRAPAVGQRPRGQLGASRRRR